MGHNIDNTNGAVALADLNIWRECIDHGTDVEKDFGFWILGTYHNVHICVILLSSS